MEKRQYKRVDNKFNVRIAKKISTGSYQDVSIDIGKSLNISAGGLLISLKETLLSDSEIRVTFLKPNTFEFFEGTASVIRIDEDEDGSFQAALEFDNLSEDEKKRLNYYINLCK